MSESLIEGPLNAVHVELGAAFAPFGGWSMPVKYAGTVGEHTAVREAVGVFDVSHLGKATVAGPGAAAFVNRVFTADLDKIHPGKAQYTLCTNETGGVIDDLIVYYVSDDELFLVPNAANTAAVVAHLAERAPEGISITDQHRDYAVLAVQGPKSAEVLSALGLPTEMEYMAYEDATLTTPSGDVPVRVCRTGYTGEHGYELIPAWGDAEAVFRALLPEITSRDGQPAGLGARDTLRTEMGYALHGHELSVDITPVQARAGWAVGWKKPEFVGRDVLIAEKEAGPARRLWGLRATGKGVLRPELDVIDAAGAKIGFTTSGTFSPTLKVGIALALIDTVAGVQKGDTVNVDVRGRSIECEVTLPPFVDANTK